MATATTKSRAAKKLARRAREVHVSALMKFLIVEDNGGDYHWIVAGDGATVARSEGFDSYDDAEKAARHVRDGAASARFERPAGGATPVDLTARRDAISDASDAERWLDEGGSFSSEAVGKWREPR